MARRRTTPPDRSGPRNAEEAGARRSPAPGARASREERPAADPVGRRLRRAVRGLVPPRGDVEDVVERVFAPHLVGGEESPLWLEWKGTLRILRPLGAVSRGNRVRLLSEGDRVFESMWAALEGARERVLFTTYTLEDDRVGRRFRDLFVAARERGVAVSIVLDAFGSSDLGGRFLAPLEAAGAQVLWFNPLLRWRTRFSRLVRNHRKILVVDDRVAFCGGMNASEDYAGAAWGTGRFRDAHLELRGPCVRDLAALHRANVRELRATVPPPMPTPSAQSEDTLVQVLESNVRRQQRAIQRALHTTLVRAVERSYLTSPYFVPPPRLVRDLADAAARGVDVRVLTAGLSDVPLVTLASRHLYGRLLRAGVRVYEMRASTLHAKTAAVDGVYASVGSFNLDFFSYRRNLEVTVALLDRDVAAAVEERFHADLALSEEVSLEAWSHRSRLERVRDWLAYRVLSI